MLVNGAWSFLAEISQPNLDVMDTGYLSVPHLILYSPTSKVTYEPEWAGYGKNVLCYVNMYHTLTIIKNDKKCYQPYATLRTYSSNKEYNIV